MFTSLVECLNWQTPNGLNVQDVNSGSMLIHAFKSNQSTLILSVTGFAHSVSKITVQLYLLLYLGTIFNQNTLTTGFAHFVVSITLAYSFMQSY